MSKVKEIIDFWFQGADDDMKLNGGQNPARRWFMKDEAFDQEIKGRFETELIALKKGEREGWLASPDGTLAYILLIDQFSRNIYRNDPRSFEADGLALSAARKLISDGRDTELLLIYRIFVYMPFMHAENREDQLFGVECFKRVVTDAKQAESVNLKMFENSLDYMYKHQAIVERFGRFPHRNTILSRESSPEEKEFLTQPGSSF